MIVFLNVMNQTMQKTGMKTVHQPCVGIVNS